MKFREYIETHQVFTVSQLSKAMDSQASVHPSLRRALKSGRIERVRRGLYISKINSHNMLAVNPFNIVKTCDNDAIFSFHSAFELLGIMHNVSSVCQFRTDEIREPFQYVGVKYLPYSLDKSIDTQQIYLENITEVSVTSKEQTIIDGFEYPERCGGIEEVIRSLSMLPYVNIENLYDLVSKGTASLAARVGWLLECKRDAWQISSNSLRKYKQLCMGGPYRLDKNSKTSLGWSNKWQLCLPESDSEVHLWIS